MRNYNNISALFGGMSNNSNSFGFNLTDYSLIKSGSYKKLMNAYYNDNSKINNMPSDKVSNKVNQLASTTDKSGLTKVKADADSFKKVAGDIASSDMWKATGEVDKDAMVSAVKKFADGYNKVVEQSSKVNSSDVSDNLRWMTSLSSTMSKSLAKIGVSVGTDNKLTVDENTLKDADVKNVKSLFLGDYSYAGQVATKAGNIANASSIAGIYNSNAAVNNNFLSMFNTNI